MNCALNDLWCANCLLSCFKPNRHLGLLDLKSPCAAHSACFKSNINLIILGVYLVHNGQSFDGLRKGQLTPLRNRTFGQLSVRCCGNSKQKPSFLCFDADPSLVRMERDRVPRIVQTWKMEFLGYTMSSLKRFRLLEADIPSHRIKQITRQPLVRRIEKESILWNSLKAKLCLTSLKGNTTCM